MYSPGWVFRLFVLAWLTAHTVVLAIYFPVFRSATTVPPPVTELPGPHMLQADIPRELVVSGEVQLQLPPELQLRLGASEPIRVESKGEVTVQESRIRDKPKLGIIFTEDE